ncbi:RnaseH-domain-containing protein, partial [Lenzites betulinus]
LTIVTDSKYVYYGVTRDLPKWEDAGWIGVANKAEIRDLVARLRKRSATTLLKWVKGHSGDKGNEGADKLAALTTAQGYSGGGAQLSTADMAFMPTGARLAACTQKLVYRGILRSSAKQNNRKTTERNLEMCREALEADYGISLNDETLWRNTRRPEIGKRTADFYWRIMHGAYKIGGYWEHVPGYEGRATCAVCGVEENIAHILMDCEAPGTQQLWRLARGLLEKTGFELPRLTLGLIMAAPSLQRRAKPKTKTDSAARLARIVVTETAHLLWKLRCERVIGKEDGSTRRHSESDVVKRWIKRLNERMSIDRGLVASGRKEKRRGITKEKVLDTWRAVLTDDSEMEEDWIGRKGVLVG